MAIKYLKLPLHNDVSYSYTTNLEDNKYQLKFLFLERTKHWYFTLKDSEQNVLVSGQRLTPNALLFSNYRLENLTGGFYFTTQSGLDPELVEQNIERPREFFVLYYIYDDGE